MQKEQKVHVVVMCWSSLRRKRRRRRRRRRVGLIVYNDVVVQL